MESEFRINHFISELCKNSHKLRCLTPITMSSKPKKTSGIWNFLNIFRTSKSAKTEAKTPEHHPKECYGLKTPFHSAALIGHLPICKLIIEFVNDSNPMTHLDVWCGSFKNITPLHLAASKGHFEIYKLYMDKPSTPLDLARENNHLEIVELIKSSFP